MVDDVFAGYDADHDVYDTWALFCKKKGKAAAGAKVQGKKGGGMMGGLKAAKDKADAAVRKGGLGRQGGSPRARPTWQQRPVALRLQAVQRAPSRRSWRWPRRPTAPT